MFRLTPWAVFANALIAGFVFGVYLETGISISPGTIAMNVTGDFVKAADTPEANEAWNLASTVALILGTISVFVEVYMIWSMGLKGTIPAAFGFAGILLIMTGNIMQVGAYMVLIGAVVAWFLTPRR